MNDQDLLNKIIDDCCDVISNSIIVRLQFEHNVDDVIFDNVKRDFTDKVRKEYLESFFCDIDNIDLENQKAVLFDNILNLFKEVIFAYVNSRADLDMYRIKKAINKGVEDWLS